ncbi:MAG: FAD-dependent oxidoreductase [Coriobacteriales bacterium]|nr:FAD-dependent oxidoreductase [Coriobacteriales bacterium]
MNTQVTRRGFLKGTAAAGLGIAATSAVTPVALADEAEDEVRQHAAKLNPQESLLAVSNTTCPNIFTPWKFGPFELPNRIVKSAAGYISVTGRGINDPLFLDYYGKILGASGAGVVYCDDFVELYDHFKAIPDVGKIVEWTEEELKNFTDAIHAGGAKAGYQLATMGLVYSGFVADPTAIFQTSTCMDMQPEEIQDLIQDTIKAAATLQRCGFDCVEINSAGENTGQTFMSRARNFREDEYGPQSFENRTRFVCEIIRGIKEACGKDFPVQILINGIEENDKFCGDSDLYTTVEENIEMCKLYEAAGADSLHVRIGPRYNHVVEFAGDLFFCGYGIDGTTGYGTQFDFKRHWQGKLKADKSGLGVMTNVAAEIKAAVNIPVGCVTFMDPARDPEFFDSLIADGKIDFMLMNRPINVEPDYIHKLQEGRLDEIRPCTRCMHCHWDADETGAVTFGCRTYAAHPFHQNTGQITGSYFLEPAAEPKNVMVVGAGPAGMEAAIVAAERGHSVTLYEKNAYTGGLLPFAAYIKGEHEGLDRLNAFYARQLELKGVNVVLSTEVDADLIAAEAPDAVIWATGGKRVSSGFESTAGTNVVPIDGIMGADIADDVVIYGSNAQAIDLAMFLMAQGKHIQIVNPGDALRFGDGHSYWVKTYTQPIMKALGCRFWSEAQLLEVGDGSVTIKNSSGIPVELACGTVIDALDCEPNIIEGVDVIAVGDCAKPWNIEKAIVTGNNAARNI